MTTSNEIKELAQNHAKETFTEEQLAHWYFDADKVNPPEPSHLWLKQETHEEPTDTQWKMYRTEYQNALARALFKLEDLWPEYEEAVEEDDPVTVEEDTYTECIEAIFSR